MKKSKIYTKTGDEGTTSLVGGKRVPKTHLRLEAYGTVDELNAFVGLLLVKITQTDIIDTLQWVQNCLFAVGGYLATDDKALEATTALSTADVERLEHEIDCLDEKLPPLKSFVFPGGCETAALCHVCRTVCRRMERRVATLNEESPIDMVILSFMNRLSDYFFVLSRFLNYLSNSPEIFLAKKL